ncbi:Dabb family protein [Paenibacillus sp. sgz500958]|uniref:Dabb family protein n=1 Tax=Paenibacillus sp. sgz500958 TaxID=3242475 RepID=UPI0036D33C7E
MSNPNIRHMVIFNLKHANGSEAAGQFLQESKDVLTTIPVVSNFEVFHQVSPKNDYDYGFSMEFASQEDYDTYNNHPVHVEYVQTRWMAEVERFLEIDFKSH